MDWWKVQTAINDFTDAADEGGHGLIRAAKNLRRTYALLREPDQQAEVLDQLFPLLDHARPEVRQCAACIILDMPIQKLSAMPPELHIMLHDKDGKRFYDREWVNNVEPALQNTGWFDFVARHMIYLEDKSRGVA